MNNSPGTKAMMILLTALVVLYFGTQGLRYFSDPLTTTLTYTYEVEEGMDLSGYVVREETLLPDESGGLLQILRSEGERVSKGGQVAAVYSDQASLDRQTEMELLDGRIEQLEYAQESLLSVEASLKLDSQILQSILRYRQDLTQGRLDRAEEEGQSLRSLVLKRDYTYSGGEDLTVQIQELKAQRSALKSQSAGSVRTVRASQAGVYSAVVDGYETVLTPQSLTDMTPSQLGSVTADTTVTSSTGKLILGDTWYYAAVMDVEEAQALEDREAELQQQGESLLLRFSKGVDEDLAVTVDQVGPEENGQCVVVLRGDTYLTQLTLLRQQSARVVYRDVTGIRVPKEALRVVEETVTQEEETTVQTTGVYCVLGAEATFKPAEVVYSGEDFVLLRSTAQEEKDRLRPGEEVIVTAKDLYDGKVIG